MITGIIDLTILSAKVFPRQILLPPPNGRKLIGFLFVPEGVRK
jgi:hypothetical protein